MRLLSQPELASVSGGDFNPQDDGVPSSVGFFIASYGNNGIIFSASVTNNYMVSGFTDWDENGAFTAGDDPLDAQTSLSYTAEDMINRGYDADGDGQISDSEVSAFSDHLRDILTIPTS